MIYNHLKTSILNNVRSLQKTFTLRVPLCARNFSSSCNLLKTKNSSVSSTRTYFKIFRKPSQDQLKIKDNVPDEYQLIYRNTMDRYILFTQIFTSVTASIVLLKCVIENDFENTEINYESFSSKPKPVENEVLAYLAFFIGTVVLLQILVSRLPIRIYYLRQQQKYTFITYGSLPFTIKKAYCKIGEVVPVPTNNPIVPWSESYYILKGDQKIVLFDYFFHRPADLHIMLGVQKDNDVDE